MKRERSFEQHLLIGETILVPGGELKPSLRGWSFFQVTSGVAYWMHPKMNHELAAGSSMISSQLLQGVLRASQLGGATIHFFHVRPERLTGVVTLAEQMTLEDAAGKERCCFHFFPPHDPVSEAFRRLCQRRTESLLRSRVQLLELFVRGMDDFLPKQAPQPAPELRAQARLAALIEQMPATEMVDLDFGELAADLGCSTRHLGRLFQQVIGTSFRQKQAEIRLARAQELLATTQSKIYEVAMESGYPSLSLFNLMFKRHVGLSPAAWRVQIIRRNTQQKPAFRRNRSEAHGYSHLRPQSIRLPESPPALVSPAANLVCV